MLYSRDMRGINYLGKMIMRDDLEERQKWVTRLRIERTVKPSDYLYFKDGMNHWRYAAFNGKIINTYFDKDFTDYIFTRQIEGALPPNEHCVIADFGSGSGHVGFYVASQLTRWKRSVLPYGFDNFQKSFWTGKKPTPKIVTYERDLSKLSFGSNAFDAGICRFALPFIGKEDQQQALKNIYEALKPGAVVVILNDGAFDDTGKDKSWNIIFAGDDQKKRKYKLYYPSCKELTRMAETVGFKVIHKEDLTDIAFGYISPQILAEVYSLKLTNRNDRKKTVKLREKFWKWKKIHPSWFEPKRGSLRALWPMYKLVLRK